jgi:hypothetical protein
MTTPRATLRVLPLPDLAPDCRRFEVDCPASVTGLTHVPHPTLRLPDETLILVAGFMHEERCGECSVDDVLDRGDQRLRAMTEEVWSRFQAAVMAGRRN